MGYSGFKKRQQTVLNCCSLHVNERHPLYFQKGLLGLSAMHIRHLRLRLLEAREMFLNCFCLQAGAHGVRRGGGGRRRA